MLVLSESKLNDKYRMEWTTNKQRLYDVQLTLYLVWNMGQPHNLVVI